MNIRKENWQQTLQNFEAWWNCESIGRPLLRIVAKREQPLGKLQEIAPPADAKALHLDVERKITEMENRLLTNEYLAEAYPSLDLDIGPGSIAVYNGSEPVFREDTVWFRECVEDIADFKVAFDENSYWYRRHFEMLRRAKEASRGRYFVNMPDLIENIDIVAAMRGPQNTCYDLIDEPELAKAAIDQVDRAYFEYYDRMAELLYHDTDGLSSYTCFDIIGKGRIAKVQCDFSALMSPDQYREFVIPSLRKQIARLDHSVYHLDGADAIRHVDALLELERLQAVQWTAGAGKADVTDPVWYPVYDKIQKAGKSLHLMPTIGDFEARLRACDRLIQHVGAKGVYLLFGPMTERQADTTMEFALKHWTE